MCRVWLFGGVGWCYSSLGSGVMRSVPVVCDELERLAGVESEWAVGARWALAWVLDFDVADDGGELL
jgi:hypothetical protein